MDYDPITVIRGESDAFLGASRAGDLDVTVPSCPEWTVRDLVAHLGVVHRFHGTHLRRGVTDSPQGDARPQVPADALLEWFAEGVEELTATLSALDPDYPAWNWSLGPQVTSFWARRMALETAIHRWDAESATGVAGSFDPAVALDGVDEVLAVHLPADRLEPDEHGGSLAEGVVRVEAVDADRSWLVRLGADGATDVGPGDGETADTVVAGDAGALFLALWGRESLEELVCAGNPGLAAAIRTA